MPTKVNLNWIIKVLMTDTASTKCDSLKRCAVCKIDLKGRFVYIDDEVEKLLGIPREDLFGKPIQDFICNESRQAIEQLFNQRNSYETCYDTIQLNIKNNDNQVTKVSAVTSLNLVSGNPVNYILIITSIGDELVDTNMTLNDNEYGDNLKALLQISKTPDLKDNLEHIHGFTNVDQICMYFINDEKLEPRYFVDKENKEFTSANISEPGPFHYQVASTGDHYDFTESPDENSPIEYICRLDFSDSEKVLFRFIFDENSDLESSKDKIDRIKLAILLLERLNANQTETDNKPQDDINIRFVVGLLDSMGIGGFLTDFNGDIIGFNKHLKEMLGWSEITCNIREFVKLISPMNDDAMETELIDNFLNSFDSPEINKCKVQLPSGDITIVTSLRLGDTIDDLSSLVVFVPYYADNRPVITDNSQFWIDTVKAIDNVLTNSTKKNTTEFVAGFTTLLSTFDSLIQPREVDLNLLVNDVFKQVKESFSMKRIISRIESLPILTIPEEKIKLVLEEIFKNSMEYNKNPMPAISVRADMIADTCCLTISDNGCGMSEEDLQRTDQIFEKTQKVKKVKKISSGLAKVNYIIKSIDGRIDITSSKSEGTTVTISFPVTDKPAELFTEPGEYLIDEPKSLESSQVN
jgi:PAS domain S-box-containing protein